MALTAQQKAIQKKQADLATLKAEIAATPEPTMAQIGELAKYAVMPAERGDSARGVNYLYNSKVQMAQAARPALDAAIAKAQAAGTFQLPKNYMGEMKWHGLTDPTSVANWTPEQKALQQLDPTIFESVWKQTATPADMQRLNQVDSIVTSQRSGPSGLDKFISAALPIAVSFIPGVGPAIGGALGATGTAASMLGGAVLGGATSGITGGNVLQGALLGGAGAALGGLASGAGTVGDTAAVLQAANPALSAAEAMTAAQAYANAGVTASQLASAAGIPASVFTAPTSGVTGTNMASNAASVASNLAQIPTGGMLSTASAPVATTPTLAQLPSGGMLSTGSIPAGSVAPAGAGMTDAVVSGALNPATAGNVGLASGLSTPAAGISSALTGAPLGGTGAASALGGVSQQALQTAVQQSATNPGLLNSISQATGLSPSDLTGIASTGLGMLGSYLQGSSAQDAAQTAANAQIEAARIAADAAKFRPVGVTTNFGASKFGYDASGNLTSAGYTLSPQMQAQQNALLSGSEAGLQQFLAAQGATAPMGQTAQGLMSLGQGYLQTTPQQQAAKYMAEQQALLAAPRADQLAALQNQLQQQGRAGIAVGGNAGMMAANPEMAAYYNALQQQDLGLAAQATQGGQQYAQFGAGLVGTGGDMLKQMYGTQTAAFDPYRTALGGAQQIESLGQAAMDIGTSIGAKASTAGANAGLLRAQGMTNAAQTMQPANAYSPWGAMLSGAGQTLGQYDWSK